MAAYFLSDRDRAILERLLAEHRAAPLTPPRLGFSHIEQTPDVYIAKPVNVGGIPALATATLGTGTTLDPSTDDYDTPGYAECKIYRIEWSYIFGPQLIPISNATHIVYNVSSNEIEQEWIIAVRTKQGFWVAVPTAIGTGLGFIWGKLDTAIGDVGTGTGSSPESPEWAATATVSVWSTDWSTDTGDDIEDVLLPPSFTQASIPAGAWVCLVRRADGEYYIIHALIPIPVVVDVDIIAGDGGTSYLAREKRTILVMAVGSESDWTNIIELTSCGTGTGT